jgi:putative glutamine amidotransferase
MRLPIVIVPACTRLIGDHPYHAAQFKYVDALVQGARCAPLILPALGEGPSFESQLASLFDVCDGIMLTGSPSNVHPSHYQQDLHDPELPQDVARDATTLPLIRGAIERGIPLLAICRGFQEVNVALGGSLHQALHRVDGMHDHREDKQGNLELQYAIRHEVELTAGGRMAAILDGATRIGVNSLHGQGIDRLAPGLQVEARADDGLVEAFSVAGAAGFTLAMQWHPEWRITENPVSMKLFGAFGQACLRYREQQVCRPPAT